MFGPLEIQNCTGKAMVNGQANRIIFSISVTWFKTSLLVCTCCTAFVPLGPSCDRGPSCQDLLMNEVYCDMSSVKGEI